MSNCLNNKELEALVRQSAATEKISEWKAHLESCDTCAARLASKEDDFRRGQTDNRAKIDKEATFTLDSGTVERTSPTMPIPADAITGYKIIKELHRGGQGVVYQAVQRSTKRKVALKVMLEGPFAGPESKRRFEREIELVGSLRHPNIVPIFDRGDTNGRFFYVMEYIRGLSLLKYVQTNELSVDDTMRLFSKVCGAVAYAHQKGVIHRDLKPSNVLVDDSGEPHVLDFGLAKVGGAEAGDDASLLLSVTGQVMGTPSYMSPEQAAGRPDQIDMRSDVYTLGVILYELLTGQLPYELSAQMAESLDTIQTVEPRRPSTIRRQINDEVETIVLTAMSKEKDRRYYAAGPLGQDIERFLAGDPIEAKRDSALYVMRKTLRRYKAPVAAGVVLFIIITTALAVSLTFWKQAANERDVAEARLVEITKARKKADLNLYVSDMNRAVKAFDEADTSLALSLLEKHHATYSATFEWRCLYWLCQTGDALHTFTESNAVNSIAFSSEGLLASGSSDGRLSLFDITSQQRIATHKHASEIVHVVFSPDGKTLATADEKGNVIRWGVTPLTPLTTLNHSGRLRDLAISADGRTLAVSLGQTYRGKGQLYLWDWPSAKTITTIPDISRGLAFSLQDQNLLAGAAGLTVRIWDISDQSSIRSWAVIGTAHTSGVMDAKFSPENGRFLATSSWDTVIAMWDVAKLRSAQLADQNMKPASLLRGHRALVGSLAFSPDGRILASASDDYTVKLWPGQPPWEPEQRELVTLRGHTAPVNSVAFSPDGEFIVSGSADNTIKTWPAHGRAEANVLEGYDDWVFSIAFSPDDRTLATGGFDGQVVLWDLTTMERVEKQLHEHQVFTVAFSPDGKWLASCDAVWKVDMKRQITFDTPGQVQLTNLSTLRSFPIRLPELAGVRAVDFSPDGSFLVIGDHAGRLWKWDVEQQQLLERGRIGEGIVDSVRVSPDGKTIAVVQWLRGDRAERGQNKRVSLLSSDSLQLIPGASRRISSETFKFSLSGDGRLLVCGVDNQLSFFTFPDLDESQTFRGHTAPVMSVIYSPDGKTLATSSVDHTVKLWNIESGQEVATLTGHSGPVSGLAFAHSGAMLASSSEDRTVRVWRTRVPDR